MVYLLEKSFGPYLRISDTVSFWELGKQETDKEM
jgi:hypothetical protein